MKLQKGFTLIELVIALGIAGILGTVAIAGFSSYNQIQFLQTATNDLASTLILARSRALSQIKIGINCKSADSPLESYEVKITNSNSYTLIVHCGFDDSFNPVILPQNITFDTPPASYVFQVLKGGATTGGQIVLTDANNHKKTINITKVGGISVQ